MTQEKEARQNREMQIAELEQTLSKESDRASDLKVSFRNINLHLGFRLEIQETSFRSIQVTSSTKALYNVFEFSLNSKILICSSKC